MNNTDQMRIFLSTFVIYLPTLLVCLVAGVVILARWRQAPAAWLWALLGFGLAMLLCFAMPLGHTFLQYWVLQSEERQSRMWAFSAFSIIGSVLHAVIYAFLLVAIMAGRAKPGAATAPPPAPS